MHTSRLFKVRKAAVILAAAFSVCVLFSLADFLDNSGAGLKLVRRDGSTITFSLPWKSVAPPAVDAAFKPVPTSLSKYLDGIANVAVALQNGGILIGDNSGNGDAQNLAVTINGVNVTASDLDMGNITAQLPGVVAEPLVSNTFSATSSTTTASHSSVDHQHEHDDDCGCTLDSSGINSYGTGFATRLSSMSASVTNLPLTFRCAIPATITETWHRTQYAETATFFSFLSVFTVTETASGCHTSSPKPVNTIQCANGMFVKDNFNCPSTMMNGSPGPGSTYAPQGSDGNHTCSKCSKRCTCLSQHSTACPSASVPYSTKSLTILSQQVSSFMSTSALSTSLWSTKPGSTHLVRTTASSISSQLPPIETSTSTFTSITLSALDSKTLLTQTTTTISQTSDVPSPSDGGSLSSTIPATSTSTLSQTNSISSQNSASTIQATSLTSSLAITSSATQTATPPVIMDYGSKVVEGASVGVNNALASVSGLTGGLLSTVLAEVNSALAEALSTVRPLTSVLPSALSVAFPSDLTPVTSLPVPTNAIGNAADILGSLLSNASPAPTKLGSSIISLATQLAPAVLSNAGQAVGSVLGSAPIAVSLSDPALAVMSSLATRVLDTVPSDAIGNVAAILNPVLSLVTSLPNNGLNIVAPALSAVQTLANIPVEAVAVTGNVPLATAVGDLVQSGTGAVVAIPVRPFVGNIGGFGA